MSELALKYLLTQKGSGNAVVIVVVELLKPSCATQEPLLSSLNSVKVL